MIVQSLQRAFPALLLPKVQRYLWISFALTLLLLVGLTMGVRQLTAGFAVTDMGWANEIIHWLITFSAGMLSWLLFPIFVPLVALFFAEDMADAIEDAKYDGRGSFHQSFWQGVRGDLLFSLKALGLNLLCLPLYLIPLVNIAVYYLLNGLLLGREFFVLVAARHMPRQQVHTLYRQNRRTLIIAGIIITFMANIPFVNLLAPAIATAMMVGIFQQIKKGGDCG